MGVQYDMQRVVLPAVAILFLYISLLLKNSKRNWFVGIRTPWTLSSDLVWKKTHKLGSVLFALTAILIFAAGFTSQASIMIVLGSIIGTVLITVVYSFVEYKKEKGVI